MTTLTKEQRKWLNKCVIINGKDPGVFFHFFKPIEGSWTLNHNTGLVDVDGNFNCMFQGLSDFKGVKFGVVTGNFYCEDNRLTSLVGAPQKVSGNFNCAGNSLTSLEGAPQSVSGIFCCGNNPITSLVGAPKKIGGRLYCGNNRLTSLEGAPQSVGCRAFFTGNPVSEETLEKIFRKMRKGDSFWVAAVSLRNEMREKDWKLIAPHIPDAIRPGVNMLGRFGLFN
jgi:hypothetical protein